MYVCVAEQFNTVRVATHCVCVCRPSAHNFQMFLSVSNKNQKNVGLMYLIILVTSTTVELLALAVFGCNVVESNADIINALDSFRSLLLNASWIVRIWMA